MRAKARGLEEMLTVDQKDVIRREYFLKRKSMRRIAREMGHSRKTVRKAVHDPGIPVYTLEKPRLKRVIGPFVELIAQWMEEDKKRPLKQRHTAKRIYERLRDEYGYEGTDRTVRREVSSLRGRIPESHVPQTYEAADGGTFDFGTARVILGGREREVHLACMRLDYSTKFFVCALPSQKQEALLESHIRGFKYLGGVPCRMRYDNMKTAVAKVTRGKRRSEQELWVSFRSHFPFEAVYCNAGEAQEKGSVENLVGYVRRNFLVPMPDMRDFSELNRFLLGCCEQDARTRKRFDKTVQEVWQEEASSLRALPERLPEACVPGSAKVNRKQWIRFASNWYSVPPEYVGQRVRTRAFAFKLEIACKDKIIAEHERSYEHNDEVQDPHHYLPVLLRKPGAFDRATAIVKWSLPPVYERYHQMLKERHEGSRGTKEYIQVLMLLKEHVQREVTAAVEKALAIGIYSFDGVKNLLLQQQAPTRPWCPLDVASPFVRSNRVDHFDLLTQP